MKDNHTWFICFAPYDKPKYAICVFLQGAKAGGTTAAPIAARIMDQALALDQGTFQVDVKPFAPAPGSFAFVNSVDFASQGPNLAPTDLKAAAVAEPQDETPDKNDEPDAATKNGDHDRTVAARPKVRVAPDAQGMVPKALPADADPQHKDTAFMHSLRNFFHRGGDDDPSADSSQDLKTQQKNLRKQQKAQLHQQQPSQPQPQASPDQPKHKKFLGIF